MGAIKFSEIIEIKSSAAIVFDYTQNYETRLNWDTFLKQADLIDGAVAAGKGVKAYCVAKNGMGMVTEYVTFNRPKVTAIKMTEGPYLFKAFAGSWTFKELNEDTTEVMFVYSYQLQFPFNLIGPLVKMNLRNNVRQRLKDLKVNIEEAL